MLAQMYLTIKVKNSATNIYHIYDTHNLGQVTYQAIHLHQMW